MHIISSRASGRLPLLITAQPAGGGASSSPGKSFADPVACRVSDTTRLRLPGTPTESDGDSLGDDCVAGELAPDPAEGEDARDAGETPESQPPSPEGTSPESSPSRRRPYILARVGSAIFDAMTGLVSPRAAVQAAAGSEQAAERVSSETVPDRAYDRAYSADVLTPRNGGGGGATGIHLLGKGPFPGEMPRRPQGSQGGSEEVLTRHPKRRLRSRSSVFDGAAVLLVADAVAAKLIYICSGARPAMEAPRANVAIGIAEVKATGSCGPTDRNADDQRNSLTVSVSRQVWGSGGCLEPGVAWPGPCVGRGSLGG